MPQALRTSITRQAEYTSRAQPYTTVGMVLELPSPNDGMHIFKVGIPIGMDAPDQQVLSQQTPADTTADLTSIYTEYRNRALEQLRGFDIPASFKLSNLRVIDAIWSPSVGQSPSNVKVGDFVALFSYGHQSTYWYITAVVSKESVQEQQALVRDKQAPAGTRP